MMVAVPAQAQSAREDPLASLAQALNLTQAQKKEMREVFVQYLEKQDKVPTPGQVVLENRGMLKEVITSADFDEQKARAFVQKVTAVMEEATVNRLHLRHDLYRKLTAEQQQKYLEMVQSALASGGFN